MAVNLDRLGSTANARRLLEELIAEPAPTGWPRSPTSKLAQHPPQAGRLERAEEVLWAGPRALSRTTAACAPSSPSSSTTDASRSGRWRWSGGCRDRRQDRRADAAPALRHGTAEGLRRGACGARGERGVAGLPRLARLVDEGGGPGTGGRRAMTRAMRTGGLRSPSALAVGDRWRLPARAAGSVEVAILEPSPFDAVCGAVEVPIADPGASEPVEPGRDLRRRGASGPAHRGSRGR